jgi:hypothetical protein
MSVLGDFESMRLYRKRALKFEQLADACLIAEVRYRYRLIAHHYIELANAVERSDKARIAPRLDALRARREMMSERGSMRVGQNGRVTAGVVARAVS